jgi:hypothetical protein
VKFTIDTTHKWCVAALGPFVPLPMEWKHFYCMDVLDHNPMQFDGI